MEKKRLKKRIQRKIIKLLSIVSLIIVLLCSLIAALYETPLAIFLPRLDEGQNVATVFIGQDETGMEQIGEALQPYYEKFNADVYQKKDGEDMEVRYNRKETNFWGGCAGICLYCRNNGVSGFFRNGAKKNYSKSMYYKR